MNENHKAIIYSILFLLAICFLLFMDICVERRNQIKACSEWVDGGYVDDPLGFLFQAQSHVVVCKDNKHLKIQD